MFKVNNYSVRFTYFRDNAVVRTKNGEEKVLENVWIQKCTILDRNTGEFFEGLAILSHHDEENGMFNKDKGRKLALTRALKNLPKDQRQGFWNEYFLHTKIHRSRVLKELKLMETTEA